jgi:dTDP-4-dehydrorhamnose reductase
MPTERWLVTGASGQLGSQVVRQLGGDAAGPTVLALAGQQEVGTTGVEVRRVDLRDADALRTCVAAFRPTHLVHLGAMSAVADCYSRPDEAHVVNTVATQVLAEAAEDVGARFIYSSTDMIFGGDAAPYREADPPKPLSHYGRTKAAAERVLIGMDGGLVVRIPLLCGLPCNGRETTFAKQIAALRSGQPLRLFTDEFRTPVWLADAARAIIGLARSALTGVIHIAGPERLSRYELLARGARLLGIASPNLIGISRLDVPAPEPRPADLSLDGSRFAQLFPKLAPEPLRAAVFGVP